MNLSRLLRLHETERPRWHFALLVALGFVAGGAGGLDSCAQSGAYGRVSILTRASGEAVLAVGALLILDFCMRKAISALGLNRETARRFWRYEIATYVIFLFPLLGALGVQMLPPLLVGAGVAFLLLNLVLLRSVTTRGERTDFYGSLEWLAFLFLVSGAAALIYQVVWQRALFAAFGINIESITLVVSLFMFGLGLGSLTGGLVAKKYPSRLLTLFVACESGVGLFGMVSLSLIDRVSSVTLHDSPLTIGFAVFALLCLPTVLMGATLPILVTHFFSRYKNLGQSVGILYFINTLGSAIACFVVADGLFSFFGQQATVMVAVACNFSVAILVALYAQRGSRETTDGSGCVEEPVRSEGTVV